MVLLKLSARSYVRPIYARGIYGKYSKVKMQHGYGIVNTLGKNATKLLLSGLGKSGGKHLGSIAGKFINDKTGSKFIGNIAKTAVGSLAGLAGEKGGHALGTLLGNTVFNETPEQKKQKAKKTDQKISLSSLLDQARSKITGTNGATGSGILLNY